MTEQPLYERLGGFEGVEALVDQFYLRLLQDQRVRHFFLGISLDRHVSRFASYFVTLLGGPGHFDEDYLRRSHALVEQRGLNRGHLDAFLAHMASVLNEEYCDDQVARDVVSRLEALGVELLSPRGLGLPREKEQ